MHAPIHPANERLLTLISEYLCFRPNAIAPADVTALASARAIPLNEAYCALLADLLGLDASSPDDALLQAWLPKLVRQLSPAHYMQDAYLQAVRPAPAQDGPVELLYETLEPMELFVADDMRLDGEGRVLPQLGWFPEGFSFPALREDGRVWMTVTPNEMNTMRPAIQASRGKVLTLGLGLGYYAFHALMKPEVESVTVVERNPAVIAAFRKWLLPFFPRGKALRIIEADAFDYMASTAPHEGFDAVFTDLWFDVADGLPLYQRMQALEYPGPRFLYWMEPTLRCFMDS